VLEDSPDFCQIKAGDKSVRQVETDSGMEKKWPSPERKPFNSLFLPNIIAIGTGFTFRKKMWCEIIHLKTHDCLLLIIQII
jgi:hypothetical protein